MRPLAPALGADIERVACIGAHADDIEIGCAGTLLALRRANPDIHFDWIVLSAAGPRVAEAETAARAIVDDPDRLDLRIEQFTDRRFPMALDTLKDYFDQLGRRIRPDVVLCPRDADAHQDHRTVAGLVWQTFRDAQVLQYEIVKYEGDLGRPNAYVALDDELARRKVEVLETAFPSQADRDWFDERTFSALMRLRGVECRAPSGWAEAFDAPKLRLL